MLKLSNSNGISPAAAIHSKHVRCARRDELDYPRGVWLTVFDFRRRPVHPPTFFFAAPTWKCFGPTSGSRGYRYKPSSRADAAVPTRSAQSGARPCHSSCRDGSLLSVPIPMNLLELGAGLHEAKLTGHRDIDALAEGWRDALCSVLAFPPSSLPCRGSPPNRRSLSIPLLHPPNRRRRLPGS